MVTIRKAKTALKFKKPASWWGSTWREAIPCGNGKVGAAVFGGAGNETILINNSSLWWQGHVGTLPDVSDKLKEVRKELDNNSPKEAESILSNALISKGYRPQLSVPLPICCLKVTQPFEKPVKEYMRVLNMENGEASVTFRDGSTRYDRSLFVSRANDMICYEITRSGNKDIDINFAFEISDKFNARTQAAISKLPDGVTTKYENFFMYFSAKSDNGTEYGAVARVNYFNGSMEASNDGLSIKGADRVLVFIKTFVESQRDKEWKALKTSLTEVKLTYDKLLKEHTSLHQKVFGACDFDLDADKRDSFVEDLLDEAGQSGEAPNALMEKLWAYGRYLFISSASDCAHPLAPYGLWCGDYKAENSTINASGSVQMLYSQALAGGLASYLTPLFSMYETVIDDLKKNAARLYSCRGIFIPSVIAPNAGVLGSVDPSVIHFTGVAGWICQLMYDYYLFTDDKKFLKERALPFMRETALFYEEFFKVKTDGYYETSPSYSPFNTPANYLTNANESLSIAKNSMIDFVIARELLTNLINGSIEANLYKIEIDKWRDMLTRIPNYQVTPDNIVREYIDHRYVDNQKCKETSHLYGAYPGIEVDGTDADLTKAFINTAKKRYASAVKEHNALSLANYANLFARLGEGTTALETLNTMLRAFAMNNLVMAQNDWRGMGVGQDGIWASYTLEGNLGATSAVQEMLVSSTEKLIKILPALPEAWQKGSIEGLATRLGVEVGIEWDKKKGVINFKLKSKKSAKLDLQLPQGVKKYKGVGTFQPETCKVTDVALSANKVSQFEIRI